MPFSRRAHWEYPGYDPHSGTPADTVNFNLLLDDVRAALDELGDETGRFYGLTAALPCGPSIIDNLDIAHVGALVSQCLREEITNEPPQFSDSLSGFSSHPDKTVINLFLPHSHTLSSPSSIS